MIGRERIAGPTVGAEGRQLRCREGTVAASQREGPLKAERRQNDLKPCEARVERC